MIIFYIGFISATMLSKISASAVKKQYRSNTTNNPRGPAKINKYINENLLNTVNYIKKRTWKTDKSIWSKDTDPVYEQSHCVTGQRFSGQWPLLHSQHWQAVNHWHCMIAATTQHKQTNTHQLRKYILNLLHENIMHILLLLSADICYSWHVLH